MRHLRDARARAAVLLGSCGLYPRKQQVVQPLELLVPERIALLDPLVLLEKSAFPAPMQTRLDTDATLSHALAAIVPGTRRGQLATTLSITTDDALAARIGRGTDSVAENLEAFAVAQACAQLSVPFAAVLSVTNAVGSQGREQWSKHRRKAADVSARVLLDWIDRGARGLPAR
jgi:nucleoside phosphorylase